MTQYVYHEMPLPALLVELLESGLWIKSAELLKRVLPPNERGWLDLYTWAGIERETNAWLLLATEDEPERIGRMESGILPGTVDPYQVVLIGDLSPDFPIALDYRDTVDHPCVLYFSDNGYWVEAADSFEEFWALMNHEGR